MIERGESAPDFELVGTDGGAIETYRLSESLAAGPTVLAFYPQDFSPVCTEELCTLHEGDYFSFVDGVDLFGISADGVYSHREFANQHGFDFPLLADSDYEVSEAYGVRYEEPVDEVGARVVKRSLFVVDTDGIVRYAWVTDDPTRQPDLLDAKARVDEVVG